MHRVLLMGAGQIGTAIAAYLSSAGGFEVRVADIDQDALDHLSGITDVQTIKLSAHDQPALAEAIKDRDAVVSALTYEHNPPIVEAALAAGASYFDLSEDVRTSRKIMAAAKDAKPGQVFMPQCGLAPGFVSIAAHELTKPFDKLDAVHLRVGALPRFPTNALKYNLTWSTHGLVNEYCNPCEAIHDGEPTHVLPLEGLEHFTVDGTEYEAFNTSGGLGTLGDTLAGRVRTLNYKTIRYPGHRDHIELLAHELKLSERRDVFQDILEYALPTTDQDLVLVFCAVTGWRDGRLTQVTDARTIYHSTLFGRPWTAIQITTAMGVCAIVDLHAQGKIAGQGLVRQEAVSLGDFLDNRFGKHYANASPVKIDTDDDSTTAST